MKTKYIFLILFLFLYASCQKADELVISHLQGKTMGTTYNVKIITPADYDTKSLHTKIDERLVQVNQAMSTYIKTSEISRFNQSKMNEEIIISNDFFKVAKHALDLSVDTGGYFDPTIGPLVNLWGFGPDGQRKVPAKDILEETMKAVGHEKVKVDENKSSLTKLHPKVYLDLSASAKGYGVDAVLELINERGITNVMVEIGGEVRTSGKSLNRDWKIGIESPNPTTPGTNITKVIKVANFALATSGDYRNFFEDQGKRYSHTINFKTGKPIDGLLASVSVISDNCMDADAKATALMAMGHELGYEYAKKKGIKAFFIYRNDIDYKTTGSAHFAVKSTPEFDLITKE